MTIARNSSRLLNDGRAALRARWYLRRADFVGPRVRLRGRPVVVNRGQMFVRDRVQLYSTLAPLELYTEAGGHLEVGARTLVNFGTSLVATKRVHIGEDCHIGPHVMIQDTSFHHVDPDRRLERPPSEPIVIEDNVWLGARVIVLPGVTIGRDSSIGAGSVVTRDVPSRTLAAGVPARVVREL